MRKKLTEIIGVEANRVNIHTFHGFCNRVITENPWAFGGFELEPLSDLDKTEVVRACMDQLPVDSVLNNSYDPYLYENHCYNLWQLMKQEGWSVMKINKSIADYLADLPNRDDYIYKRATKQFVKGDLKIGKIEDQKDRMKKLQEAVSLFSVYKRELKNRKLYDYSDMISWVLGQFSDHSWLLKRYQEQFLYILVDEYQDTNGSQYELTRKLADYWKNPNLFVVGDDDQSIFEFQGARLKNLIDLYADYQKTMNLIVLDNNYRSVPEILNTAGTLIENNLQRASAVIETVNKKLVSNTESVPNSVQATAYANPYEMEYDVVQRLAKKDKEQLKETAVIYAKHRQVERLMNALDTYEVPYYVKRSINILNEKPIKNAIILLRYFDREVEKPYSGDDYLFHLFHMRFSGVSAFDFAKTMLKYKQQTEYKTLGQFLDNCNKHYSYVWADLVRFVNRMYVVKDQLLDASVIKQVTLILNATGFIRSVSNVKVEEGKEPELDKRNVQMFFHFINFLHNICERRKIMSLGGLLDVIDTMVSKNIPIDYIDVLGDGNGVQLMTAHGSKGLEFDEVILYDCGPHWMPENSNRHNFTLPDTLTYSVEEDKLEARRRLFYVALTRAKSKIDIVYSTTNDKGKQQLRCQFIEEIIDTIKHNEYTLAPDGFSVYLGNMTDPIYKKMQLYPNRDLINERLNGFELSPSSYLTYLECEVAFFFQNIIGAPKRRSASAAYGIAMHYAVEKMFSEYDTELQEPASLARVQIQFRRKMDQLRTSFTDRQFQIYLKQGSEALIRFYKVEIKATEGKYELEKRFSVDIDGVKMVCVIDRIDYLKGNIIDIIDYKTGTFDPKKIADPYPLEKAIQSGTNVGRYARQVMAYKICADKKFALKDVGATKIKYLDKVIAYGKETTTLTINHKPGFESQVRDELKWVWERIHSQKFARRCNKKSCTWCQFLKDRADFSDMELAYLNQLDDE